MSAFQHRQIRCRSKSFESSRRHLIEDEDYFEEFVDASPGSDTENKTFFVLFKRIKEEQSFDQINMTE